MSAGKFARSLGIRHLVCGSCNGCELEMNALAAPQYDISQEGWGVVASPRHADIITVTGPMSGAMRLAAQRTIEAATEPVVIVAVGDCATGEGVWCAAGSAGEGAGKELQASIGIPGCPPSPDALREGLRAAATLLDGRNS